MKHTAAYAFGDETLIPASATAYEARHPFLSDGTLVWLAAAMLLFSTLAFGACLVIRSLPPPAM